MRALPSFTQTPTSNSSTKIIETCKVISLRICKEYEGSSQKTAKQPMEDLKTSDTLEEEISMRTTITPSIKEITQGLQAMQPNLKTSDITSTTRLSPDTPKISITPRFVQEISPPPFPPKVITTK